MIYFDSEYKEDFMFETMKVAELREVADAFGVDTTDESGKALSKKLLLAALAEEGVTSEDYAKFTDAEKVDLEVDDEAPKKKVVVGPEILVKMNRANPTYEIKGHRFTREHPYIAMSQEDAQEIFDYDPRGFVIATPAEVQQYYS